MKNWWSDNVVWITPCKNAVPYFWTTRSTTSACFALVPYVTMGQCAATDHIIVVNEWSHMPPNGKMLQIPVQDSRASHAREACDKKLPTKRNSNYKKTNTMTRRPVRMLFNSQCQILDQQSDRVGRKRRLCSLAKLKKKTSWKKYKRSNERQVAWKQENTKNHTPPNAWTYCSRVPNTRPTNDRI